MIPILAFNWKLKTIVGILFIFLLTNTNAINAQKKESKFKVIAFYTAKEDPAHISFVHEANKWFSLQAEQLSFIYDSTNNWNNMNETFLSKYQVVIFLDTRPDLLPQRFAFQKYMESGGAWMGFHFSAFALTQSDFNQNWNWYHEDFLGAGEYKGNTWRPTNAQLKVEQTNHPFTKNIPSVFMAAANEWYSWKNDLRKNKNIVILLSIDNRSFPLGTGPKPNEIWQYGDYPVAWTNIKYRMLYFNIGHNDMDYDGGTNQTLSSSFSSELQNRFILNSLLWLGEARGKSK